MSPEPLKTSEQLKAQWPLGRTPTVLLALLLALAVGAGAFWSLREKNKVIRLGILHAQTGPMAISEKPMIEAELMAIDEINAQGGVLGRKIEGVVVDTASSPREAARKAEKLITEGKVAAVIGCWTSACRKAVKPVVESHESLLIYPMAYEGLEASSNIIYTGAAPNQQVLPATNWAFSNLGKRFLLVGSDYIWPHAINAIIADQINTLGGQVAGELYLPFGSLDASAIIEKIRETKPDVILSSIVGDSNPPFYRALKQAGFSPEQLPVISFAIAENEANAFDPQVIAGHYAAWGYFESIKRPENTAFIERFKAYTKTTHSPSDVIETAYFSVHLWARAIDRAESVDPVEVLSSMLGLSYNAPEGIVTVDPSTHHAWRNVNVGQVLIDGNIRIVWSADHPIRPVPYPHSRSMKEWDSLIEDLYIRWKNNWINPEGLSSLPEGGTL